MAGTISRRSFHLLVGVYVSAHLAFASAKVLRHPSSAMKSLPAGSLQVGGMPDVDSSSQGGIFLVGGSFRGVFPAGAEGTSVWMGIWEGSGSK